MVPCEASLGRRAGFGRGLGGVAPPAAAASTPLRVLGNGEVGGPVPGRTVAGEGEDVFFYLPERVGWTGTRGIQEFGHFVILEGLPLAGEVCIVPSISAGVRKWRGGPAPEGSAGARPRVPESRSAMSIIAGHVEISEIFRLPEACPGGSFVCGGGQLGLVFCMSRASSRSFVSRLAQGQAKIGGPPIRRAGSALRSIAGQSTAPIEMAAKVMSGYGNRLSLEHEEFAKRQ